MARRRYATRERRMINRYIGACEGLQEKKYFDRLKQLIDTMSERKYDVEFAFTDGKGGSPLVIAKKAYGVSSGRNPVIATFDYDGKYSEFVGALDFCKQYDVFAGYTNYCFDLWILLHKQDFTRSVAAADDYQSDIKRVFGLPDTASIKQREVVEEIMKQISLDDVHQAIERAERLVKNNKEHRVKRYSPSAVAYYENPDIAIHTFVKRVLQELK